MTADVAIRGVINERQKMTKEKEVEETKTSEAEEADEFMAALDDAVEEHLRANEPPQEDEEKLSPSDKETKDDQNAEQDRDLDSKDGKEEGETDGDKAPVVSEALLERAVRAGLSMTDAKAVSDEAALTRIVESMEKKSATGNDGESADESGDENPDDTDAEIPDLDPDRFAGELVDVFKTMKATILQQNKVISELKNGGGSPSQATWADAKFADLGKDYESVFGKGNYSELEKGSPEASARDRLQRHMTFLIEDAKLDGKTLSQSDAFQKALETGFGDVVNKIKGSTVKEKAAQRARKATNRPRSSDGRFASERSDYSNDADREEDAIAAVAALMEDTD